MFPAFERALNLNGKGPLTLLTHYQTPMQLRRAGHKRLATYLKNRGVKGSNKVADKALEAAKTQSVTLPAHRTSRPLSSPSSPKMSSASSGVSRASTRRLGNVFSPVRRLGFSLACRVWCRSSGPSSFWWSWATSAPLRVLRGSLLLRRSCPGAARDSGKRVGKHRFLGEEETRP